MTEHKVNRFAAALSLAALLASLLAACGGGDRPAANAHPMADAAALAQPGGSLPGTERRQRALAVQGSIDATMLFNWIETEYPSLFPRGPQNQGLTSGGRTYTLRYYPPPADNYAGVGDDGNVYGLGGFTDKQIKNFGPLQSFACSVAPNLCVEPPLPGALNECIDPAASALPTGFNIKLVYTYLGSAAGEQNIDSTIIGPASFKGQTAVEVRTAATSTINSEGATINSSSTSLSYEQAGANGLIKTLGSLHDGQSSGSFGGVPFPGTVSKNEVVYNPPTDNIEFTLQPGQSLTKTVTSTVTTFLPAGISPVTSTHSETYTFEAKETIQLSSGKSYNTCRYRNTSAGDNGVSLSWLIVGKGVAAKTQSTANGQTQTSELKSGSYNGQPL